MFATDWIGALAGAVGTLIAIGAWIVALVANSRSKEANRIARNALEIESRVDERQREFRAVEWDAIVMADETPLEFELRNTGDTPAVSVTIVLHLGKERETHELGNIAAKSGAKVTSDKFVAWMTEAFDHEVVNPGYRVHWSSPLGQVSDVTMPIRTVDDFIDWEDVER
jgi:hypothetical protein